MEHTLNELRVELVPRDDKVIRGFVNKEELRQLAIRRCKKLDKEIDSILSIMECKANIEYKDTGLTHERQFLDLSCKKEELMRFFNLMEDDLK